MTAFTDRPAVWSISFSQPVGYYSASHSGLTQPRLPTKSPILLIKASADSARLRDESCNKRLDEASDTRRMMMIGSAKGGVIRRDGSFSLVAEVLVSGCTEPWW